MKKMFIGALIFIMLFGFSDICIKATSLENEFIPKGYNYLSDDRCTVTVEKYDIRITFNDIIRVKPSTEYTLFTLIDDIEMGISDRISLYSIDKSEVVYSVGTDSDGTYVTFTTTSDTAYLDGYFIGNVFNSRDFKNMSVTEIFVLYEGTPNEFNRNSDFSFQGVNVEYTYESNIVRGTYYSDVDKPVFLGDITSLIKATDNYDGDLTDEIVINYDHYSDNFDTLGTYDVEYQVTDSNNNSSKFILSIVVKDNTKPVLTGIKEYIINPDEVLTSDIVLSGLMFTDNYDSGPSEDSIMLTKDTYSANKTTIGTYSFTYLAKDSSGNSSRTTVTIRVKDTKAPTISGVNSYEINSDESLSESEVRAALKASDSYEGDITSKIVIKSDNYSGNENMVGTYTITYQVSDSSNNYCDYPVTIVVRDTTPPVFIIPDIIVNISSSNLMLDTNIIKDILKRTNMSSSDSQITIIEDQYTDNKDIDGTYNIKLLIDNKEHNMIVNVNSSLYDDVQFPVAEKGFFESIWDNIVSFFESFKNLF